MQDPTVTHNTFVIERNFSASPERVFAALADPARKRRWFAEGEGSDLLEFEMDFRVGGAERTRSRLGPGTPVAGLEMLAEATYLDVVPGRRIVQSASMSVGGHCISAALATYELLPAGKGTDLIFTHQAAFFEGADGPEMRQQGWRKILDRLAQELTSAHEPKS